MICICAASNPSPATTSMPAMARSGTSRIFWWKTPTGAFTISSSIPEIGGQAGRFLFHRVRSRTSIG